MKLIVSVMPRSLEEAQALDATRYLDADIIEWRADYLPKEAILQVAPAIFEKSFILRPTPPSFVRLPCNRNVPTPPYSAQPA